LNIWATSEERTIPGDDIQFETLGSRWPSIRNLGVSLCAHVGVAWILATISSPVSRLPERVRPLSSTTIQIGDRLYYVVKIARPQVAKQRGDSSNKSKQVGSPPKLVEVTKKESPKRIFVPPDVKREPVVEVTLLQPDSVPNHPKDPDLPSFKVWSVEVPKIPKPFVAPGKRVTTIETPQLLAQPGFEVAQPALPTNQTARLTLPAISAPLDLPDAPELPRLPPGDPVNIISESNRPALPDNLLVVPPGSVVGEVNPGRAAGNGSGTGPRSANIGSGASASPSNGGSVGGTTNTVIIRSADGNFDTVIVQSSPLDLFPEGRHLLTGRPVYIVYVAVGTAKDWVLYFCVDGGKAQDPGNGTGVVQLTSAPLVRAPYPTRIVRPKVSLPKYQKYVLLHARVTEGGRFSDTRVVNPGVAETDRAILEAVNGWEFRPANRDGVPVVVEVLLAIPAAGL
jgi:hypothetical protein